MWPLVNYGTKGGCIQNLKGKDSKTKSKTFINDNDNNLSRVY